MTDVLKLYDRIKILCKRDATSVEISPLFLELYAATNLFLQSAKKQELVSKVTGKKYFAFMNDDMLSRAVNKDLYLSISPEPDALLSELTKGSAPTMTPIEVNRTIYKLAMSFCCAIDLTNKGDRQTQGTYFQALVSHLIALRLQIKPQNFAEVGKIDGKSTIKIDLLYDFGPQQPKFHVPVKTSTRERGVQAWSHQQILDKVFGVDRFTGLLVCIAETKTDSKTLEVIEICTPDQWRNQQNHIARMTRVYYLDIPRGYAGMDKGIPRIYVKPFGEFFFEIDTLTTVR